MIHGTFLLVYMADIGIMPLAVLQFLLLVTGIVGSAGAALPGVFQLCLIFIHRFLF